ncbi:MAG: asparagine synthase (glutamine-hydrolyzing) [Pseudolabrys sp.]|nr:asparagine synthase (glutamine-hydrolyzing) [Pseudolabrys sp.]
MCGIFASLGIPPLKACIDIVEHRGPDGEGWRVIDTVRGPLAFGHRRLAIIDLRDAASQPMDFDGRYCMIFNGEIYNYIELRHELAALGYTFKSQSDSEVLMASYAEWGEGCLDRLNGMFAFLIWDATTQILFAARDRFGIKPLYYAVLPDGVVFASEIKQFLCIPSMPRRMNLRRVRDFLSGGILDHTAETMFEGVRQLRGGECATINLSIWRNGAPPSVRRWYNVLRPGLVEVDEASAAEQFRALFHESVKMHMRSDVSIGSCLSGGLDSSSIVCLMDQLFKSDGVQNRVNTFSACYSEKSVDERPYMNAVIDATRCSPHFVFPSVADAFDLAERITWQQDEPYGSTSIFAQWCVFEAARKAGVKVMLDGQGADEPLSGYHGAFGVYVADLVRRGHWLDLIKTVLQRREYHGLPVLEQIRAAIFPLLPQRVAAFARRRKSSLVQHDWMASPKLAPLASEPGAFDVALREIGLDAANDIGSLCVALTQGSNLAMLLHWEDRNSMAHGVEARVPFLDHRLVEFSIALGSQHKIVHGDTKRVLRRAMAGILPTKVVERRDKLGFATPEEAWFRGPARGAVIECVEDTLAYFPELLNEKGTRALVSEMLDGGRPIDFTLWRIINLGIWGRTYRISG